MNPEYDYEFKLLIVGDANVGKSSLLLRFSENVYRDGKIHSFGIIDKTKFVKLNGKRIKLQMRKLDRGGCDRIDALALTSSALKDFHGIIVVYNCTKWESFDNLKQWFNKIDRYFDKNINKLLVGNKCDCVTEKVVGYEIAKEYANQLKILFLETSAKDATNVEQAFMTIGSGIKNRFDPGRRLLATTTKLPHVKEPDEEVVLHNYENKFLHKMNEMRKQNNLCDVRFIIKGKEFPCHKIMLMNATLDSEYFKTLFTSNFRESDSDTISLQDVEPEAMEEILTAIYTTRFHLNRSNAYFILRASHMFLLMDIFNAVVPRITENPSIDYLIETCLFAQTVQQDDLHQQCIATIAADLDNLSKTVFFQEKITFEMFKTILKHENLIHGKEALFQIIMQWSNNNKISEVEVFQLLKIANWASPFTNAYTMAKLIVNSYTTTNLDNPTSKNENTKRTSAVDESENSIHHGPDGDVCYVYLNTVDVKSGAKGWATLQSKLESNEYEIINYQQSNSSHRKVAKVGNKLYCFEYDTKSKKILFNCFENDEKTYLASPWSFDESADTEYYDIEVLGKFIYLITGDGDLWTYDCETNYWIDLPIQHQNDIDIGTKASRSPSITSCNGELLFVTRVHGRPQPFIVIPNQSSFAQSIKRCPRPNCCNDVVCGYDNKLVCSSNYGILVYDTVAQNWYDLEKMNVRRAGHTLNYHNGFLYAIENRRMTANEKYDIKLNKWTLIPSLPQRLNFIQENVTLATGRVFNCTIE